MTESETSGNGFSESSENQRLRPVWLRSVQVVHPLGQIRPDGSQTTYKPRGKGSFSGNEVVEG